MKHIDHNITFTIPGRQKWSNQTTYKGNVYIYCRQKSSSIRIIQTYSNL